jgi:hypothetical protein
MFLNRAHTWQDRSLKENWEFEKPQLIKAGLSCCSFIKHKKYLITLNKNMNIKIVRKRCTALVIRNLENWFWMSL